jgi:hypothetical protein
MVKVPPRAEEEVAAATATAGAVVGAAVAADAGAGALAAVGAALAGVDGGAVAAGAAVFGPHAAINVVNDPAASPTLSRPSKRLRVSCVDIFRS